MRKTLATGHVGRDPETRYTPDGKAVTNFSLADNDTWRDASGQKKERTEWMRWVAFGKLAEFVGEHVRKGSHLHCEGKQNTRSYEKDGITHYVTEIVLDRMEFLGPKPEENQQQKSQNNSAPPPDDFDDDIPF